MRRRERLPQVQRVAAYAVVLRDGAILMSRLSDTLTATPMWTLPGGGLDHGEDPRAAVVREVQEETGLDVVIGETAWVLSSHQANAWRRGRNVDAHALRIVYDGWVAVDAPEPRTVEVGGSTAEAAWLPLADVLDGTVPTVPLVLEALTHHHVTQVQRVGVYGLLTRGTAEGVEVLLTRIAPHAVHGGRWHLPGGGIDFGESPREALRREFQEETGLEVEVGRPLDVRDVSLTAAAPSGRWEEFHGIHLIFAVTTSDTAEPAVVELDGTTDAVEWVAVADVASRVITPQTAAALRAAGLRR
ncbi:MAG: NUDIX domain-containing protein [Nocardioides sp.]|uniref:NUDIX hydrolase n=1 Tax=Nocardioides sp. TaxID=35761 RepID=UPI0039E4975A